MEFSEILESAARLQTLVPDAVLVGGSAAAIHAGHRLSTDHDHVIADLRLRFESVLDALESDDGWATNRITPGKVILGSLDGIETGVRQMIRTRPLETEMITLGSGTSLTIPTAHEALRIKAFLAVRRNRVRDYVDAAALSDLLGVDEAAQVLSSLDAYYSDQIGGGDGIATQIARQFADPRPADVKAIRQLGSYKQLDERWTDWAAVTGQLAQVATAMVEPERDDP